MTNDDKLAYAFFYFENLDRYLNSHYYDWEEQPQDSFSDVFIPNKTESLIMNVLYTKDDEDEY
jgi:hypothetical protein